VSTTEELLGRKSSGFGLESREYGRRDPSRLPRGTLYPQKLALTSPKSGGRSVGIVRSRNQATEFSFSFVPQRTFAQHYASLGFMSRYGDFHILILTLFCHLLHFLQHRDSSVSLVSMLLTLPPQNLGSIFPPNQLHGASSQTVTGSSCPSLRSSCRSLKLPSPCTAEVKQVRPTLWSDASLNARQAFMLTLPFRQVPG
jgi:hypothetical protein